MSPPYYEDDLDLDEDYEPRECTNSCPHFDSLNLCCWQSTPKGICFDVREGSVCAFGYRRDEDRPVKGW